MTVTAGSRAANRAPGTVLARIAAVLVLVALARAAFTEAPLASADVLRFLKAGLSEAAILYELRNRGFAGPLDASGEESLRGAGASETLIVALRRAPAGPSSAPAGANGAPPSSSLTAAPAPDASKGPWPDRAGAGRTDADAVFAVRARTVRVPVSVVDQSGDPILGLRLENFRLAEEGKKQKVTLFSGERRPLRIALALDVSRSMGNKIRQVEEALKYFIALLEPADEILVIAFSDRVHVVQDFTSDRGQLAAVLDKLEPAGGTALYDAAFVGIQRVARGPAESKAVVLVTDGLDTSSTYTFKDLRELARRTEVPVFSIGIDAGRSLDNFANVDPPGPGILRPFPGGGGRGGFPGGGRGGWPGGGPGGGRGMGRRNAAGFDSRPLQELAEETGGRAEIIKGLHYLPGSDEAPGSDQLKKAVEAIATTLRYRYLLGYEPPEGNKGWRTIRVDVDRAEATARARKGYYGGA